MSRKQIWIHLLELESALSQDSWSWMSMSIHQSPGWARSNALYELPLLLILTWETCQTGYILRLKQWCTSNPFGLRHNQWCTSNQFNLRLGSDSIELQAHSKQISCCVYKYTHMILMGMLDFLSIKLLSSLYSAVRPKHIQHGVCRTGIVLVTSILSVRV